MTDIYLRLGYQDYKRLEKQLRSWQDIEMSHTTAKEPLKYEPVSRHDEPVPAGTARSCCTTVVPESHQGSCPNSKAVSGEFRPWATELPPAQE